MNPENPHKDIPGNPSTAKSSKLRLNDRSNRRPLKVLSEEDWAFWQREGYIVIKGAVPKQQAQATAGFLWEFEEKMNRAKEICFIYSRFVLSSY